MIAVFLSFWILLIILLLFIRFKYGLAFYLAYSILVPYLNISFGGMTLQWNFVNLLLLIAFFFNYVTIKQHFTIDWKLFSPFLCYFLVSLLLMFFQEGMPLFEELNLWRGHVMASLIFPFAIWNYIKINKESIILFRKVLLVCVLLAAFYGLFLTLIPGTNPYITMLADVNGAEFDEKYALASDEGRLFGRISSVFVHPMSFGLFLGLSFVYLYSIRKKINAKIYYFIMFVIIADILFCGVRSVIVGLFLSGMYYIFCNANFKLLLGVLIIGLVGVQIISFFPDLASYLGSLVDLNNEKGDVTGSSLEMRAVQFLGCLSEISNCLLFGKGYGWTQYYTLLYEFHPIMLGFESLVYVVLCNSGIIGVLLWVVMCLIIIRYNHKFTRKKKHLLNCLLIFFLAYSITTGLYNYLQYYILFYILLVSEMRYGEIDSEKCNDQKVKFYCS